MPMPNQTALSHLACTRRSAIVAAFVALVATAVVPSGARAEEKRASPHEKVSATVGTAKITIEYGRPLKKGRPIFGKLVPYGEVWRTGADEATTLTTDGDLTLGTLKVGKGSYALFTLPTEKGWTLIVNKNPKQWGAYKYDAKEDLGRTAMKVEAAAAKPVEQFTIAIEPGAGKAATLKLSWDTTVVTVPVTSP